MVAPSCSVKPLTKTVTAALKLTYKQMEHYHLKTKCYSGVETFIDAINRINWRNKASSVSMFDFCTLDINIPHYRLKSAIGELTQFVMFSSLESLQMVLFWPNDQQDYNLSVNETSLKWEINYSLDNCYFAYGSIRFCQLIGNPMRSNAGFFITFYYFYYYYYYYYYHYY